MYIIAAALSTLNAIPSTEVVLAHFDEPLDWTRDYASHDTKFHVYLKGEKPCSIVNPKFRCSRLPNVGRESHTYLTHIVQEYDNLADWTVFSQAGAPSFGYRGHRDGGGHLASGYKFEDYLELRAAGYFFVYTAAVLVQSLQSPSTFLHTSRAD
jgi:hypothetical protein